VENNHTVFLVVTKVTFEPLLEFGDDDTLDTIVEGGAAEAHLNGLTKRVDFTGFGIPSGVVT